MFLSAALTVQFFPHPEPFTSFWIPYAPHQFEQISHVVAAGFHLVPAFVPDPVGFLDVSDTARLVELARGANLLVHDAQYTAEELEKRRGWGHSSFDQAMQLAEMAGVKHLALTHHDPEHDDQFLEYIEKLCRERFPNTVLAREGMEICVSGA
jgi:phosphoribosyl 1,2-cyclic phosphodiesterase